LQVGRVIALTVTVLLFDSIQLIEVRMARLMNKCCFGDLSDPRFPARDLITISNSIETLSTQRYPMAARMVAAEKGSTSGKPWQVVLFASGTKESRIQFLQISHSFTAQVLPKSKKFVES
jgi:hypothetical protein